MDPHAQSYQSSGQHPFAYAQPLPQSALPTFAPPYPPQFRQPQQYFPQQQHQESLARSLGTVSNSFPSQSAPRFSNVSLPAYRFVSQPSDRTQRDPTSHVSQSSGVTGPVAVPAVQQPSLLQKELAEEAVQSQGVKQDRHFKDLKYISNPPDRDAWRKSLFDVEDLVILTEDEFQTYFPHIDNIYSHRSTQDYKRKPFISHYYDCRLKGRPAGTPKSSDPNKKKRKRIARERDLCHVKIKITEYLPGASQEEIAAHLGQQPGKVADMRADQLMARGHGIRSWVPGREKTTTRFYTFQRVNGTGPNSKEGEGGGHQHTIEESDRIKKNSVIRFLQNSMKGQDKKIKAPKTYHTKATGAALQTVKNRSKEHTLKLYGSCFCPFVQRVWISLEHKRIPYQYVEIDPYQKPEWYLKLNPRGLVPSLQDGEWCCYESSVLMEYLEDISAGQHLLPADPKQRAHCRLWSDHINRKIIAAFYPYLQAQEPEKQVEKAREFKEEIEKLVRAADPVGPFFMGSDLGFVDVQIAPWLVRLHRVLKPYRGWPEPEKGSRWARWVEAVEGNESVKATMSDDQLYLDSYERYAENRPGTSQVADAVNAGKGLP